MVLGGAGLELRTKAGNFLVEGRYYYALSDFYKSTKKDYFSRSAHGTIVAKITYLFDSKINSLIQDKKASRDFCTKSRTFLLSAFSYFLNLKLSAAFTITSSR